MNKDDSKHPVILMIDELIRTSSRLRSIFSASTQDLHLSKIEVTVLTAVVQSKRPPTVPQIGRSLGSPRQVIQRAANRLVDEGLIETAENPDHKRAKLLLPTSTGRQLKRNIDRKAVAAADKMLELLDVRQCEKLTSDLRRIRREIESYVRKGNNDGPKT